MCADNSCVLILHSAAQNAPNIGTILIILCMFAVFIALMKLKLDVRWGRDHLGSSMRVSYTKVAVTIWVLVNSPCLE